MKIKDLDKVEAWSGGAILPPGQYKVRIDTAEEGESSGGHPQIEMEFMAENGSGSIRDWLVYVPATAGKVKSLLVATGIQGADSQELDLDARQLVGKRLTITVAEEPDNRDPTRTRRRVVAYAAAESDVPNNGEDSIPF